MDVCIACMCVWCSVCVCSGHGRTGALWLLYVHVLHNVSIIIIITRLISLCMWVSCAGAAAASLFARDFCESGGFYDSFLPPAAVTTQMHH